MSDRTYVLESENANLKVSNTVLSDRNCALESEIASLKVIFKPEQSKFVSVQICDAALNAIKQAKMDILSWKQALNDDSQL